MKSGDLSNFWKEINALYAQKKRPRVYYNALKDLLKCLDSEIYTTEAEIILRELSFDDCARYADWSKKQKGMGGKTRADQTQRVYLEILQHTFQFQLERGYLSVNPWKFIKKPKSNYGLRYPTRVYSTKEVQKILDITVKNDRDLRNKAIITILFACGLRRSEVANLKVSGLERDQDEYWFLHLEKTKGGKDADVYLPDWAIEDIANWQLERFRAGARKDDPMFVDFNKSKHKTQAILPRTVARILQRRAKQVGIERWTSGHSPRATAITKLLKDKTDVLEVKKFARHKNLSTVESYDHRHLSGKNHPARKLKY